MNSPWRTTREAAEYLRITHRDGTPDPVECLRFIDAHGIPTRRRGARAVLVHVDDLDAALAVRELRKGA
jgi:hypothetical protein